MSLYDRIADLPLSVDAVTFERRERDTSSGFTRVSTVVVLEGEDATGRGEDVTYDATDHEAFFDWIERDGSALRETLVGDHTIDSLSSGLASVDLFPERPDDDDHAPNYRRWAFESAALDLACRQRGTNLGAVLDREYDPVTFVASARLGEPPSADRIHALRDAVPDLGFKLDPTPEWDDVLVRELAETGAVRVVDLKGLYEGTEVDQEPDPALYRRVIEGFPNAVVEDPALTDETRPIVEPAADRLSWDYPITDLESYSALAGDPAAPHCNVKPSRFGSLESLFAFLDHCLDRGVGLYGGGQFELDAGRGQIQALASLCYPDGPNDVAPRAYNDPEPPADPPRPPLDPGNGPAQGFGFRNPDW